MLDAYIIDAIRREEEERQRREEASRVRLELPLHRPLDPDERAAPSSNDHRGPIVIPFNPGGCEPDDDAEEDAA